MLLGLFMVLLFLVGIQSKSVHNTTFDESKFVSKEYFEEHMENMTDLVLNLIEKKSADSSVRVFFHAKMEYADITFNKNSIVKFKDVLYNEGNHFFPGDSIFIAPVSGVYLFSWTIQSYSGKTVATELRVANVVKERIVSTLSTTGIESFTRVLVCKVNKGEHVWIQTARSFKENFFYSGYNCNSSFMGVLLFTN